MTLPSEVKVNIPECNEELYEAIIEYVSNYLCEEYGVCQCCFAIDVQITASDILWDTDEEDDDEAV